MNEGDIDGLCVTISVNEYQRLLEESRKLGALDAAGVDSWEWYEDAMGLLEMS